MNSKEYERMINNIERMSPIESGVQTLVFWLLNDIVESTGNSLVVIDRMQKKSRFISYAGISDLAIVTNDFDYNDDTRGNIIMCIEVKNLDVSLFKYQQQILGQLLTYKKALFTNGKDWYFYDLGKYISDNCSNDIKGIGNVIKNVLDNNRRIAELKLSLSHIKKEAYRQVRLDEIKDCEKENSELEPIIENFIASNNWLTELLDDGTWNITKLIDEEGFIDNRKYLSLLSNLSNSFAELRF